MSKRGPEHGAYVDKVREGMQRYTHDLLAENERLRTLMASLESERQYLEAEVAAIRDELARYRRDQGRLQTQLLEIEQENQRFSAQYVEVERQHTNLANLYVASYRLHGTLDRAEVVTVVQEILANMVGTEESAIFEAAEDGLALALVASTGIEPGPCRRIAAGQGLIGRAVASGEPWIRGATPAEAALPYEADLTACIPLVLDGRAIGAIALFRLLPQKSGVIEELDRELFDLLATHAATALYCSARSRQGTGAEA